MFCKSENDPIGSKNIGFEAWAMKEQTKSSLNTWQREILRKIYGTITHQNGWGIGTDDELRVLCAKSNIVRTIKGRRLELAGHMVKTPDDRTVKSACMEKTRWKKKNGKTKIKLLGL